MKEQEEIKFLEFTKNNKEISANFLKKGMPIFDFLLGIAATIKVIKEETGKSNEEILNVVIEIIKESEEKETKQDVI